MPLGGEEASSDMDVGSVGREDTLQPSLVGGREVLGSRCEAQKTIFFGMGRTRPTHNTEENRKKNRRQGGGHVRVPQHLYYRNKYRENFERFCRGADFCSQWGGNRNEEEEEGRRQGSV